MIYDKSRAKAIEFVQDMIEDEISGEFPDLAERIVDGLEDADLIVWPEIALGLLGMIQ